MLRRDLKKYTPALLNNGFFADLKCTNELSPKKTWVEAAKARLKAHKQSDQVNKSLEIVKHSFQT